MPQPPGLSIEFLPTSRAHVQALKTVEEALAMYLSVRAPLAYRQRPSTPHDLALLPQWRHAHLHHT